MVGDGTEASGDWGNAASQGCDSHLSAVRSEAVRRSEADAEAANQLRTLWWVALSRVGADARPLRRDGVHQLRWAVLCEPATDGRVG